jgi:hypothetical protein
VDFSLLKTEKEEMSQKFNFKALFWIRIETNEDPKLHLGEFTQFRLQISIL